MEDQAQIQYCLYARKSSESDERQAMSIGSQVKEMKALAKRDSLEILEIYQESHSAKISNTRAVFNKLLADITQGKFNGILTWAPDRLSRNAGDLGMLVDLMDQKKLLKIRTFSQSFSDNPNEKFLLMILCSQAKLENDNRGLNVKRGIRAKCEMGWRPGPAPLGYINRSFAGVKEIAIDQDRAPFVTKMFKKVADGASGRDIKKWADKTGFNYKSGKPITLSQVYRMLRDPFYYGRFEYRVGSGNWYQGKHEPLVTKELFEKVREKMKVPKKSKWGKKVFTYKGLIKCASCKSSVIGEERFRKRKFGKAPKRHIYYHCSRTRNLACKEPYATKEKLEKGILRFINFIYINHPKKIHLTKKIQAGMENFKKLRDEILIQQDIDPDSQVWDVRDYAKHVLGNGSIEMKRELFSLFDYQFYLQNRNLTTLRAH